MDKKISIITITYNAASTIERTLLSVQKQTALDAIEYILIDGASKDATVDIAHRYCDIIDVLVSEPDCGIYDAMNKGLQAATAPYVWFVNAGDEVASRTTVEELLPLLREKPAVVYGNTMLTDMQGCEIGERRLQPPAHLTAGSFKSGMLVCHQSFIADRLLASFYDLRYKYSADYGWCLEILEKAEKQGRTIVNSNKTLSRFLDGGLTKSHIKEGLRERFCIMVQHFGLFSTVLNHIPIAAKFFWFLLMNKRF